jgi:hypothetical protein
MGADVYEGLVSPTRARRFGFGSVAGLAVVVATGVAMASHFSLWHSDILRFKLVVFVLVAVLLALHV